jgi:hypothetical protein
MCVVAVAGEAPSKRSAIRFMKTLNPKIYSVLLDMTYGCTPIMDDTIMLQVLIGWVLEIL